jgi:hypothetical protein
METPVTQTAWHYTTGALALQIIRDGVIRPATAGIPAGERPVVWFSTQPHWEQTANKLLKQQDGTLRSLSFEETIAHGGGGGRFGLPLDRLLPWPELALAANIGPQSVRALERAAQLLGADCAYWYGSVTPVATSDCEVECLENGTWCNFFESVRERIRQAGAAGEARRVGGDQPAAKADSMTEKVYRQLMQDGERPAPRSSRLPHWAIKAIVVLASALVAAVVISILTGR